MSLFCAHSRKNKKNNKYGGKWDRSGIEGLFKTERTVDELQEHDTCGNKLVE